MALEQQIIQLAQEKLTDPGLFVVDVIVSARKGPKKVLVVLDGDNGVSIDDCAELSRQLSQDLEEMSALEDSYTLEVSTPGLDQPLKLKRQYVKNVGRKLKVKLADRVEEGTLAAVTEETIMLTRETGRSKKKETTSIEINFSQIEKAFVLVSFK